MGSHSRASFEVTREGLISEAKTKFPLVVSGLSRILRSINEMRGQQPSSHHLSQQSELFERNFSESQQYVVDTINRCFSCRGSESTFLEDESIVRTLVELLPMMESSSSTNLESSLISALSSLSIVTTVPSSSTANQAMLSFFSPLQLRESASKLLYYLSRDNFDVVYTRFLFKLNEIGATTEEAPDMTDVEVIQHLDLKIDSLTRVIRDIVTRFPRIKKHFHHQSLVSIEKAIWSWISHHPDEFNALSFHHSDDLWMLIFIGELKCWENYTKWH